MKRSYRDLAVRAVHLGKVIRRYRSAGKLQSVPPPSIYGYRSFLRMARALPGLSLRHVALATMLGHVNKADRKLIPAILKEALDTDEDEAITTEDIHGCANNSEFSDDNPGALQPWENSLLADPLCMHAVSTVGADRCVRPLSPTGTHGTGTLEGGSAWRWPIFEQAVELSGNMEDYEKVLHETNLIIELLTDEFGVAFGTLPESHRRLTSGCLDSGRLGVAQFTSSIFKRAYAHESFRQGFWPLSLIACDGSGSITPAHMRIIKMLSAALLSATIPLGVPTIMGLYHSGSICKGVTGPVVRWIYHPEKTGSGSLVDAAQSVIALQNQGSGVQSDALSLDYMTAEARRLARGRRICLTVISDCNWNSSFDNNSDGTEEVRVFFHDARKESNGRLYCCLVGLGVSGTTGMEQVVDEIVTIPEHAMRNPASVARGIALRIAAGIAGGPDIRLSREQKDV